MKTVTKKKAHRLSVILAIAMVFTLFSIFSLTVNAAAATDLTVTVGTQTVVLKDTDGDGFYEIGSADALYAFAAAVNGGNTAIDGELTANITVNTGVLTKEGTLNGDGSDFREWTPIGSNTKPFEGSFTGNGHTVSGLYFNDPNVSYVGLFGNVTKNAANDNVIAGIGVVDSYFNGNRNIGGVVGYNTATVTNCYNEGFVLSKNEYAGGIVGRNLGTVVDCYNEGTINGNNYVGGIVGANDGGVVTKSYNTGKIHGENAIGGVVAYNTGSVTVCYNTGAISGSVSNIGGVVGENEGNVEDCYNVGTISGYPPTVNITAIGGVVGLTEEGTVINCYYLNTCGAAGEGTAMTEEAFKSGEVTYLLNSSTSEGVLDWYQLITIPGVIGDDLPQFNNNEYVVYNHPREAGTAFEYSNHKHEWVFELKAEEEGKSDASQHTANQLTAYCKNADGNCHWHNGNGGTLTLRESNNPNYKYYNYKIYDGSKADVYYEYSNWYFTEDHTMEIRYYKCDAMIDANNPLTHDHTTALDAAPVNAGYYCMEVTYTHDSVEYTLRNYYEIIRRTIHPSDVSVSSGARYDGENHIPGIWFNMGRPLVENTDYTIKYYRDGVEITDVNTGFTDAGIIKVEITGIGNYTGTVVKTYEIEHPSISDSNIYHFYFEIDDNIPMYDGDGITFDRNSHKLEVFVSEHITYWKDLVEGRDYAVKFYRNGVETTDFTNAGEIQIVVTGINNYTGEVTLTFDIYRAYIDHEDVTLSFDGTSFNGKNDPIEIIYNGTRPQPEILVTVDGTDLTFSEEYIYIFHRNGVETTDFTNAGEVTLILRGVGNYAGFIEIKYTIKQAEITDPDVSEPGTVIYNQADQKPVTNIVVGSLTLVEGRDYTVTYTRDGVTTADFKNIGEIVITVEGIGNYFGTITKTYTIEPATITDPDVTISGNLIYDTNKHKSDVFVTVNSLSLKEGRDYTVKFYRNGVETDDFINVGEITVTVEGINNYIGTVTKTYTIEKNTIVDNERYNDDVCIEGFTTFTGSAQMPDISVILRGTTLVEGRDYTVTYTRNGAVTTDFTNEGTITVTINGIGNYTGTVSGDYVIRPALINFDDVFLYDYDVIYNTFSQKPIVSVYDDYTRLEEGRDYTLTYTRNGVVTNDFTNAGTIVITVTGKGNYSGTVEETYVIYKAHLSLSLTSPVTVVCPGNNFILSVNSNSTELPAPTFNSDFFTGESISTNHNYLKITVSEDFVFGFQDEYEITIIATYAETDNYYGNSAEITLKVRACGDCDEAIADLEWALENLAAAMRRDDLALAEAIIALDAKLQNAITTLKAADEADKAELIQTINDADKALAEAIIAVQKNLDDAKLELNQAITAGDKALADEIAALRTALETAKIALEAAHANDVADLITKIETADKALTDAIAEVQKNLDDAKAELNQAITAGDKALADEIDALNKALADAIATLEAADAANKAELIAKIDTADKALADAIAEVHKNLDDAKAELNQAITAGDKALADEIDALNKALADAIATLEATDAANKAELIAKIETADKALADAIAEVQKNLDDAKAELNQAITAGDKALADEIDALNKALADAIATLEATDAANKAELVNKIETADKALADAIAEVQKNLDDAKAELNQAITAGDKALADEIAALRAALEAAKTALEATDAANKAELIAKIETADKALADAIAEVQKNLDDAKAELNQAITAGDKALADEIAALRAALEAAKTALEATDAANKAELIAKIDTADKALADAIAEVQKNLDDAKTELNSAIANGDKALSDEIAALRAALEAAKTALGATDTANKTELVNKIETADKALTDAIAEVQKNLDDAKTELNSAITNGDKTLADKITALEKALADAKAALEATDSASASELTTKIEEADAALKAAIDTLSAELNDVKAKTEALENKNKELQTLITVIGIVAGIALCGSGAFMTWFFIDRKKRLL